jgi:hypothetical protein
MATTTDITATVIMLTTVTPMAAMITDSIMSLQMVRAPIPAIALNVTNPTIRPQGPISGTTVGDIPANRILSAKQRLKWAAVFLVVGKSCCPFAGNKPFSNRPAPSAPQYLFAFDIRLK